MINKRRNLLSSEQHSVDDVVDQEGDSGERVYRLPSFMEVLAHFVITLVHQPFQNLP